MFLESGRHAAAVFYVHSRGDSVRGSLVPMSSSNR